MKNRIEYVGVSYRKHGNTVTIERGDNFRIYANLSGASSRRLLRAVWYNGRMSFESHPAGWVAIRYLQIF